VRARLIQAITSESTSLTLARPTLRRIVSCRFDRKRPLASWRWSRSPRSTRVGVAGWMRASVRRDAAGATNVFLTWTVIGPESRAALTTASRIARSWPVGVLIRGQACSARRHVLRISDPFHQHLL